MSADRLTGLYNWHRHPRLISPINNYSCSSRQRLREVAREHFRLHCTASSRFAQVSHLRTAVRAWTLTRGMVSCFLPRELHDPTSLGREKPNRSNETVESIFYPILVNRRGTSREGIDSTKGLTSRKQKLHFHKAAVFSRNIAITLAKSRAT